jgi:putative methyltransferase (TIGR04325 family)
MTAPIVLFVYARPNHTQQTIKALLANPEAIESDLIVFSDAAKTPDKQVGVEEVRRYIGTVEGFCSITVHQRTHNYGLAKSIIEGVTQVLHNYDTVIVLEDDMVTSPHFLAYMNEGLNRFAADDRIISIHGYVYPVTNSLPEAFFLRGADCWGWATWRRGWNLFNPNGQFLLDELNQSRLLKSFDFNGAYGYSKMLQRQINGFNDSWAVRWYASAFLANKLTLYPGRSLVHNIGNDSSGTHCGESAALDAKLSATPICLDDVVVEESSQAKKAIEDFFRAKQPPLHRMLPRMMSNNTRQRLVALAKDWLPPALLKQLRHLSRSIGGEITFEGPFPSWDEAAKRSTGYDGAQILEKVLSATLMVKRGEAVFERDSVLFDDIQYSWPITAGLMWAAVQNGGRLSVLDFGGSLGTSYFQNRKFLERLDHVRWSIVEQPHFVEAGRQHIQDEKLVFYPTITDCIVAEKPNVALLSSVLQYLPSPYVILEELVESGVEVILLDRTSFHTGHSDLIAMQKVSQAIYPATYPFWIFSKEKLVNFLSIKFELVASTLSPEGFVSLAGKNFSFNGFVMRRKDS